MCFCWPDSVVIVKPRYSNSSNCFNKISNIRFYIIYSKIFFSSIQLNISAFHANLFLKMTGLTEQKVHIMKCYHAGNSRNVIIGRFAFTNVGVPILKKFHNFGHKILTVVIIIRTDPFLN